MSAEHPALWWRLMLAIVLMAGFYVLALGLAGGLLYLPYAIYKYGRVLHFKLVILSLLGAAGILWAVLPRFDRFRAPGPPLKPGEHPRLFQEISGVAGAVGQPMPVEVYLVPEVNAWVTNRGGVMGLGSRRIMGLGLPLLQVLSVSEFRAVLVHEFGHYHGGDTALAPWVYKTRSTIGRTLEQLGGSLLQKPFIWYGNLFLRLTNAVARKQEYAADALAAKVTGPGPIITGLKKLYQAGPAFETFWGSELEPLLANGFRPPLAEGFQAFISSPEVFLAMQEAMIQEMEQSVPNPYDTHPSLKDRIAALEKLPAPAMPIDDHPGLALIGQVAELEKELIASLYGEVLAREFQEIAWKDSVARVYVPVWREKVREYAKALTGLRLGELPECAKALSELRLGELPDPAADGEEFLRRFNFFQGHTLEEQKVLASLIVGAAVAAALYGAGCQVTNEFGEPFKVLLAGEWVAPFSLMTDLNTEALPAGHWQDLCSRAGLSDLDLGPELPPSRN